MSRRIVAFVTVIVVALIFAGPLSSSLFAQHADNSGHTDAAPAAPAAKDTAHEQEAATTGGTTKVELRHTPPADQGPGVSTVPTMTLIWLIMAVAAVGIVGGLLGIGMLPRIQQLMKFVKEQQSKA